MFLLNKGWEQFKKSETLLGTPLGWDNHGITVLIVKYMRIRVFCEKYPHWDT